MANSIAIIWHRRILAGDQSYANCPNQWKHEVLELLQQDVREHRLSEIQFTELTK